MTKVELADLIKKRIEENISRSTIEKILDIAGEAYLSDLKKENSSPILGLGSLKIVERAARQGRNPQTGEPISIPARKAPKFTPSKALKNVLN